MQFDLYIVFNFAEEQAICITISEVLKIPQMTEQRCSLSLADCVDLFLSYEQLNEDNMWYCKQCKKHMRGLRSSTFGPFLRSSLFTSNATKSSIVS